MENLNRVKKKKVETLAPTGFLGQGLKMDRSQSGPGPAFLWLCNSPWAVGGTDVERTGLKPMTPYIKRELGLDGPAVSSSFRGYRRGADLPTTEEDKST